MIRNTLSYARELDFKDSIKSYREKFWMPQHEGKDCIYLCGNSLGLQPKDVKYALLNELDHWKEHGVEGHFKGSMPWMYYHKFLLEQSANIVGAKKEEVVVMNTLTTNLHLMMVSFYRPTTERFKIIMEGGAFPSDQYAMESQVKWHGFAPEEAIVELHPREGEDTLRTEDIIETIKKEGSQTALIMMGGVNYYTGQFYDLASITKAGHAIGTKVGFDLAHAVGNVPLQLHDWNVDFAVWCSYKYLNSGPGGPSGVFVHEKHGKNPELPRFAGWWGHNEDERFQMKKGFIPMEGAAGWQLSNAQVFSMAAHKVSLDIFNEVGMTALREKSEKLTAYMIHLIEELNREQKRFNIITPKKPEERGCQLSILTGKEGPKLFEFLTEKGVIADWREPNVIRIAIVPLYNSFEDVYRFVELLNQFNS